jgi:glutamate-1-semialdehyde 2,1-aminomutase
MGSSRLPGKVMKKISGKPCITFLLNRLTKAKKLDDIIVATSINIENKQLIKHVVDSGFKVYVGSEHDVLERFFLASQNYKSFNIIRITGDCPLVDPRLLDKMIEKFEINDYDYLSNIFPRSYPKGLDIEIFTYDSLKKAHKESSKDYEREHVTPYMRESGKFKVGNYENFVNNSNYRLTVDWPEDFQLISDIFNHFKPDIYFSWEEVITLAHNKPDFFRVNEHLIDK